MMASRPSAAMILEWFQLVGLRLWEPTEMSSFVVFRTFETSCVKASATLSSLFGYDPKRKRTVTFSFR